MKEPFPEPGGPAAAADVEGAGAALLDGPAPVAGLSALRAGDGPAAGGALAGRTRPRNFALGAPANENWGL